MQRRNKQSWYLAFWAIVTAIVFGLGWLAAAGVDRAIAARTLGLGFGAAAIAIPLGLVIAWAVTAKHFLCRLLLVACLALLLVPMFLHVSAWDSAFGRLGWFTSQQGKVLVPLISGWTAAIWIHGIASAPTVALIVVVGILGGNRVYEEQALLDTSSASVFFRITLRRLAPLIGMASVWVLITCSREIAVTDIYQIGTLAEHIYLGFSLGQFDSIAGDWSVEQLAAAQSLGWTLSLALIGWISISAIWMFTAFTDLEFESDQINAGRFAEFKSGWARPLAAGGLLLLVVAVPASNLFLRGSFFVDNAEGIPTPGYSVTQLISSLSRALTEYRIEFQWSLIISLVAASLIMLIAVVLAWLSRTSALGRIVFVVSLGVSCALPGPLIGMILSRILSSTDNAMVVWLYDRTIFAPVMANIVFCWPLAAVMVWFVFRKVAADVLEHSRLEGASWLNQLVRVGIGGNLAALFGCWLICIALCFGELSASQMVLPPGIDTVPRLTLGLLHAGVDEMTAALTIVNVTIILLFTLSGWWLIALQHPKSGRQ